LSDREELHVFIGMPHYGQMQPGAARAMYRFATEPGSGLTLTEGNAGGSLLARTFNQLWGTAISNAARGSVTHFAMMHADIEPLAYTDDNQSKRQWWLDILLDEMERTNADVIGVVSPIKDQRGLTSIAVDNPVDPWQVSRRLTMREILELPGTFDAADLTRAGLNPDGSPILVNTGMMLVDLRKPWIFETEEDGQTLKAHFEIDDRITWDAKQKMACVQVIPEDWKFSRQAHAAGAKVCATQKVKLHHRGEIAYDNHLPWGSQIFDVESIGLSPPIQDTEPALDESPELEPALT